jgi:hypothetical protein
MDEVPVARVKVSPLASPAEVAAAVSVDQFDDEVRKECVLEVERRWTVAELPDDELLDAIGHCYGVLATVVAEAHERCGVTMQTFGGETHEGPHGRRPHPSGRLPCMSALAEYRTAYWHLGAAGLLSVVSRERLLEKEDDFSDVEARYGPLPDVSNRTLHPDLPHIEHARYFHEMAKRIIVIDGMHWPMAFIFRRGEQVDLQVFNLEDQQDKIVMMRKLAADVERVGADMVIYTSEIWTAPAITDKHDPRARLRAGERDDRTEAICTYLFEIGAPSTTLFAPFTRDPTGSVILGETTETQRDDLPIFRPIFQVWKRWGPAEANE